MMNSELEIFLSNILGLVKDQIYRESMTGIQAF